MRVYVWVRLCVCVLEMFSSPYVQQAAIIKIFIIVCHVFLKYEHLFFLLWYRFDFTNSVASKQIHPMSTHTFVANFVFKGLLLLYKHCCESNILTIIHFIIVICLISLVTRFDLQRISLVDICNHLMWKKCDILINVFIPLNTMSSHIYVAYNNTLMLLFGISYRVLTLLN